MENDEIKQQVQVSDDLMKMWNEVFKFRETDSFRLLRKSDKAAYHNIEEKLWALVRRYPYPENYKVD